MNRLFGDTLKPYALLKAEYKAIRQQRRHFSVTKHVPYTNVWDFKPVQWYPGKHPCEKPLDLMKHIVAASSRVGDMVLDTFTGGGTTAIACLDLERQFEGGEIGRTEFEPVSSTPSLIKSIDIKCRAKVRQRQAQKSLLLACAVIAQNLCTEMRF